MNPRGLRAVIRDGWRLAAPYYKSEERVSAWVLLISIIVLNLSLVGMNVVLNFWNGAFFDSLQNKDQAAFINLLLTWRPGTLSVALSDPRPRSCPGFIMIAVVYIIVAIYATYLMQWLQMNWRRWMTERLLSNWLSDRAYYTIGLQTLAAHCKQYARRPPTTPTSASARTSGASPRTRLRLGISLMRNVVTLITFSQILWTLSGVITVFGVQVPGYMLFVAIAYAIVGTMLTHLVGRPLARIEFEKQRYEADFRYALVRVRENAEGVALYNGESSRARRPARPLRQHRHELAAIHVAHQEAQCTRRRLRAGGQASSRSPSPRRATSPVRSRSAASPVSPAPLPGCRARCPWFLEAYQSLAVWRATVDRLSGFQHATAGARALAGGGVQTRVGSDGALALDGVTLELPNRDVLLAGSHQKFPTGHSTVISGRSGSGKSTLFRAPRGHLAVRPRHREPTAGHATLPAAAPLHPARHASPGGDLPQPTRQRSPTQPSSKP